ncbi:DUF1552 domain-containing protein [Aureliella helgolandensis]|uniref:DUF1552 domain-containing protein n=1 Tax=Aureliella helgolandensis TaxID=2527968 RepID=A0A518GA18_9BACT|nr:DUF1552 domain-containing protein [Aureliella helgolandensis]QDV25409.1 hypothetical protein Q31a_37350 [Aureliella helgolandensis]
MNDLRHSVVTRRNVLRGLGVSLALPWLEATSTIVKAAEAARSPTRMAFIFVPNGVALDQWTPTTEGYGFKLSPTLQPLAPVREDLLVLSGLTHDKGRANGDGAGDHARSASVFLTGAQPRKTDGENIRSGVSVDQVAAQAIGQLTRFSSLELGVDPGRNAGNCDSGYSCAYSSNISWSSESAPVGKEVNPRLVFERLFAGGKSHEIDKGQQHRSVLHKSVLDFIADDAKRLQSKLGRNDNRKLDEYLTGVREVERRLGKGVPAQSLDVDLDYAMPEGIPGDYQDHMRLMCDMMILAFQTDATRVSTMMFANAGDNKNYRKIGVPDGHHDLSHHGNDPLKLEKISQINRFHVQQLSYLLQRMKSIREGERTLLDNSMVCYGSAISDGNRHNNENLPIVLAGSAGGTIDTGRHIRVPAETPMCNLFLSMLERMGVNVPFVGDSTGQIGSLTV